MNHGEVLRDLLHVLVVEEGVETRLVYKETAGKHNVLTGRRRSDAITTALLLSVIEFDRRRFQIGRHQTRPHQSRQAGNVTMVTS